MFALFYLSNYGLNSERVADGQYKHHMFTSTKYLEYKINYTT